MSRGFEDRWGNTAEAVLSKFGGLTAIGGCAPLTWGAEHQGLGAGGADDHDVDRPRLVVHVREDEVGAIMVPMVCGNELFSVDGSTPPCVKDLAKRIGNCFVSLDRPSAICAGD